MADMWLWTCESCGAKTATECDKFDAADVRCAMCGSVLVGDEQKGMAVVKADRLAALERIADLAAKLRAADGTSGTGPRRLALYRALARMEADAK